MSLNTSKKKLTKRPKMNKTNFSEEQKFKALEMAKVLFPEYKSVTLVGSSIRFSSLKKNSVKDLMSKAFGLQHQVIVPIFELVLLNFPERISLRKAGNKTFAPLYLVQITYIMSINPSAIVDHLYDKIEEIKQPFDLNRFIEIAKAELNEDEDNIDPRFRFMKLRDR